MRCRGKNFFRGSVPDPVMRPHLWTHPPVGPVGLSPHRAAEFSQLKRDELIMLHEDREFMLVALKKLQKRLPGKT